MSLRYSLGESTSASTSKSSQPGIFTGVMTELDFNSPNSTPGASNSNSPNSNFNSSGPGAESGSIIRSGPRGRSRTTRAARSTGVSSEGSRSSGVAQNLRGDPRAGGSHLGGLRSLDTGGDGKGGPGIPLFISECAHRAVQLLWQDKPTFAKALDNYLPYSTLKRHRSAVRNQDIKYPTVASTPSTTILQVAALGSGSGLGSESVLGSGSGSRSASEFGSAKRPVTKVILKTEKPFKLSTKLRNEYLNHCKQIREQLNNERDTLSQAEKSDLVATYKYKKSLIRESCAIQIQAVWKGYQIRRPVASARDRAHSRLVLAQETIRKQRQMYSRPQDINLMNLEQLVEDKAYMKRMLNHLDKTFKNKFGRLPTKQEKEVYRPIYEEYRKIKDRINAEKRPQNLSEMSIHHLKAEKRALQIQLNKFEKAFRSKHGRKIQFQKDIAPVKKEFDRYLHVKSALAVAQGQNPLPKGQASGSSSKPHLKISHSPPRPANAMTISHLSGSASSNPLSAGFRRQTGGGSEDAAALLTSPVHRQGIADVSPFSSPRILSRFKSDESSASMGSVSGQFKAISAGVYPNKTGASGREPMDWEKESKK